MLLAGFIAELFAGIMLLGVVFAGVIAGAGVLTGATFTAILLALLAVVLVGASPQAIPRALNPRTVENTITFVILFKTPIFTQRIKPVARHRPIVTQPFYREIFLSQGKR